MRRRGLLLICAMAAFGASSARAHPLHTSVASITETATGEFTVSLRVFLDDFLRHTGAVEPRDGVAPDVRIVNYLMRTFVIIDRSGRGVPVKWCGSRREADLLFLCLSGRVPGGIGGATVRYSILTDLFADQVNILQVSAKSRKQSLLFTPAEKTRRIR